MFLHPFDRDCGIETAGLRQGGLRLVHLAIKRIGGRQVRVGKKGPKTESIALLIGVDRGVEMAEAELRIAHDDMKRPISGSRGTQPHRLLHRPLLLRIGRENFLRARAACRAGHNSD